jgi:3-oxoacyl-[acyl-carrier-protein] synthase-3
MYSKTLSDGTGWHYLKCEAHGSRYPSTKKLEDPSKIYMQLEGRAVYQLAVRRIVEMVDDCKKACNVTNDQIKFLIPHQMNARIIESAGKRLGFSKDQVFVNIETVGNTSAASIPIALDDCRKQGKINSGDIVLLAAFGGGLTWGANIIEF